MAKDPTPKIWPSGTAYRTNKDLRATLFSSFPRSDDGSDAKLPDLILDTIQPVINLAEPEALAINATQLERVQTTVVAIGSTVATVVAPANERWLIWYCSAVHTDLVNHWINILFQQPAIAGAPIARTDSINLPAGANATYTRPTILQPTGSISAKILVPGLTAGQLSIDCLITRYSLTDQLPQVEIGF